MVAVRDVNHLRVGTQGNPVPSYRVLTLSSPSIKALGFEVVAYAG